MYVNHMQIIVPINHGNTHWTLAVIDVRNKKIYHLDSMSGGGHTCTTNLRRYIIDEAQNKDSVQYEPSDFTIIDIWDVPQQHNGSDCGVFTCKFADFESRNESLSFEQEHMTYFRERIAAEVCIAYMYSYRLILIFILIQIHLINHNDINDH